MKNMIYTLLVVIATVFSSCNKNGGGDDPVAGNGNLMGYVRNAQTQEGIKGVVVSDGYSCTVTDKTGKYAFDANAKARCVSVVVPSAYKIPLDAEGKHPLFYAFIDPSSTKPQLNNFYLEPLEEPENDFTIIALGDQHLRNSTNARYFKEETLADIKSVLEENQPKGRFPHCYIFGLGDLMHYFDAAALSLDDVKTHAVNQTVSTQKEPLVFFNCIGNHDHDPWVEGYADAGAEQDYLSETPWVEHFGPNNYSLDRGGVHIIVLDNVVAWGNSSDTGGAGKNTNCKVGINIQTLKWLQSDIEKVQNPASKTLVVVCHIPFAPSINSGDGVTTGLSAALNQMVKFKSVEIISGHIHNPVRYSMEAYKTAGGVPVYEHNLRSICGVNWTAKICNGGAPNGYSFFEFSNGTLVNYIDKGTAWPLTIVMRVYDGSAGYDAGSKGTYKWYVGTSASSKTTFDGKMVVTIPGARPEEWLVELVSDGYNAKMTKVSATQCDWCSNSFWQKSGKDYALANVSFWTVDVPSGISALKNWKVVATYTSPESGRVYTYECNTLTTSYSSFGR